MKEHRHTGDKFTTPSMAQQRCLQLPDRIANHEANVQPLLGMHWVRKDKNKVRTWDMSQIEPVKHYIALQTVIRRLGLLSWF